MVLSGCFVCSSMSALERTCFFPSLSARVRAASVSATLTPLRILPLFRTMPSVSKLGAMERLGSRTDSTM
jgi:hypothetical protein